MKYNRILALALALCLALSLVLTGCSGTKSDSSASVQSVAMLMGVEISGVNQYSGITEAQATVKVRKDANKKVAECFVEVGDEVHKGDKLFSYDTDALELTVTSAELEVEQLKNTITNYETQIKALEKEKKKASSSEQLNYTLQIQEAELNKSETEYNLKKKEAELEQLKDSAGETEVYAEVDGIVKSIQSDDSSGSDMYGSGSSSGSDDAYITIMETGTYRIKGTASEESIRSLYSGMEMTAYSRVDSSAAWHGTVDTINTGSAEEENNNNNYYDGDSGQSSSKYSFYVALDDSEGLLIGQHVYLKPGAPAEDDSIRLPSGYLMMDGDKATVWAADSKDKLELRTVTLGEYDEENDEYIIADGLTLEDYIAYPEEDLKAGMPVIRYDEDSFGGDEDSYGGDEELYDGEVAFEGGAYPAEDGGEFDITEGGDFPAEEGGVPEGVED